MWDFGDCVIGCWIDDWIVFLFFGYVVVFSDQFVFIDQFVVDVSVEDDFEDDVFVDIGFVYGFCKSEGIGVVDDVYRLIKGCGQVVCYVLLVDVGDIGDVC